MGKEYPRPVVEGFDSFTPFFPEKNIWLGSRIRDGLEVVLKGERPLHERNKLELEVQRFEALHRKYANLFPNDPHGHRTIVPFVGFLKGQAGSYVATEFIEPTNYVVSGNASVAEKIGFVIGMTDTFAFLHRHDRTVKDFVPHKNDFICYDGNLENWLDVSLPNDPRAILIDLGTTVPRSSDDAPIGTMEYSSPEQLRGEPDRRADVYALGVNLYRLLTGLKPFTLPELDFLPDSVQAHLSAVYKESHPPDWKPLQSFPQPISNFVKAALGPPVDRPSLLEARRELMFGLQKLRHYD